MLILNKESQHPCKKPNEETNYIHLNSDQPLSILKQLSMSTEKGLSSLSSSKELFKETAPYLEQCLSNFRYRKKLNYHYPIPPNVEM